MLQHTQQGADLLNLAMAAENHLREAGHEIKTLPNDATTAFDIVPAEGGETLCRVQAVGKETWEIARAGGETLTGFGDHRTFLRMLESIVSA